MSGPSSANHGFNGYDLQIPSPGMHRAIYEPLSVLVNDRIRTELQLWQQR